MYLRTILLRHLVEIENTNKNGILLVVVGVDMNTKDKQFSDDGFF